MAILTKPDGIKIWRPMYRKDQGKEIIKANGSLPSTPQLAPIFQVFEDNFTDNAAQMKLNIEGIVGRPINTAFFRILGKSWLKWKAGKL